MIERPVTLHRHPPRPAEAGPADPARRALLQSMAAAATLAASGCKGPPAETILPYVDMPEGAPAGEPVYYATSLVRQGAASGVLVRTNHGRPTKIEGNPRHPASLGATDIYAQAAILQLWDPDRSGAVVHGNEPANWDALRAALRQRLPALRERGGDGLHILTGLCSSPTLLRQLDALAQALPGMRWYVHEPLSRAAAADAAMHMLGRAAVPRYRLRQTGMLLTLDADLAAGGPDGVRHAHDLAQARRQPDGCRVYAIESTPGLIGTQADRRISLPPWQMEALLERLAAHFGVPGCQAPPAAAGLLPDGIEATLRRLLRRQAGHAAIAVGDGLSGRAHQIGWALNAQLGNLGATVQAIEPPVRRAGNAGLADLLAAMEAGRADTLLILDANPVHELPASGFAQALARVPLSVHMGLYRDETGRATAWHAPRAHDLEAWSDARAGDGTAGIVQPVIAPLHDAHSPHALLAIVDGSERGAHDLVRQTWRAAASAPAGSDAPWNDALRQGLLPDSAYAPLPPVLRGQVAQPAAPRPAGLLAVMTPDPRIGLGEYANNAWLQELPHPFTRITWENALLLGPATAREHEVASGDVVDLATPDAGPALRVPVHVLARQAEGIATLAVGYGRRAGGAIANGIGVNAHALRPARRDALLARQVEVQLRPTGARHAYARIQNETSTRQRDIVRVLDARALADGATARDESGPRQTLYPPRPYPDHAWAMSIDLDACVGCGACTIACQAENNIAVVGRAEVARGRAMPWIRVDLYEDAVPGQDAFQPVPCMHCENAPCEEVCPVGATVHDSEGLNAQVYNRCIGTRFCSNNCPYKVRRFNFFQYAESDPYSAARRNPDVTVRRRGVMEKCTYCVQRISRARIDAGRTGRPLQDGDVVTACQGACPTQAIVFGDLNDPASAINRARQSPRRYALLEELNTRPRTTYLARVAGRLPAGEDDHD
ncbi:4Fe-4S dicluster domain-containing protein [Bordetella petrii]|nr:4Fe-4S dicluster domain-containing protein [Bordetella petrii]